MTTVVVLRALGLGDLLTAVPALRALRRAGPRWRLLLAAPAWLGPAAAMTGVVDGVLPTSAPGRGVPGHIPWPDGEPRPALAVDLHGCGPRSLRPLRALRPRRLCGYAQPAGPRWRAAEHERERWCRLLRWHGLAADPGELRIAPPPLPPPVPGAVVLHPGADAAARRWPAERFAAVARSVRHGGRPVVVTAGPAEEPLARRVATLAGLPPSAVATPGLRGLTALLAGARAVVVGDTGVAHLATALSVPSVVLFGPVSPRLWGPPPSPHHRVLWHPGVPAGSPHARHPDPRLLRVTPDEVLSALADLPPPCPPA